MVTLYQTKSRIKNIFYSGISKCLVVIAVALCHTANAQLVVDTLQTPQSLVNNVLLGQGVSAFNIQCNCQSGSFGFFDGTNSNIGIPAGVLLTSGSVFNAPGPNLYDDATTDNGIVYSDPQLTSIEPTAINDPTILEFDFIPDSSHVEFKYVFASEEYNEFVDDVFNDAFGFFLTGPGITDPNNNIALIPSTTVPITINNVNNGNDFGFCPATGPCNNCQYYFDNCGGTTVEYDGFTTVLTAEATVTSGLTYHIKMAIADAGDGAYDSGVFLQCGSFSSREGGPSPCAIALNVPEEAKKLLSIYPNPAKDVLNVRSSEKISGYEILNTMGQLMMKHDGLFNKSFSIDTRQLAAGTYIFKTFSQNGDARRLFIKN